ncbi:MAG: IgGFc-binding protein [Polyangiales bacterium]
MADLRRALAASVLVLACKRAERPPVLPTPDAGPILVSGGVLLEDAGAQCLGSGILCEGQGPYQCVNGARAAMEPCAGARPFCVPGVGCLSCPPSAQRCDPAEGATPQRCADDGSRWIDLPACASDQRCVSGRCGDPCDVPDGAQQYLGCDYWATATPNSQLSRSFPFAVALANPQRFAVQVQIRGGALTEAREITLAPGAAEAVTLPWVDALAQQAPQDLGCECGRPTNCANTRFARSALARGGAYQVHATAPVAAYQFNPLTFETRGSVAACLNSFTNDASLLLSQRSLTRRYLVLTAPNLSFQPNVTLGGFIAVVATTGESTSVTVRLPENSGVPEAVNGVVRHDNLMPGDVALVVGTQSGDLSGALVEASNPVAVFAGHDCTRVPQNVPACDHLEEQVLPFETLGQDFVVSDLRDRDAPTVLRMVATVDDTVVSFTPSSISPPRRLAAGQVISVNAQGSTMLRASHPVQVVQMMTGLGFEGDGAGDPAMVTEVPTQQFRDRYDILVPATYTSNFLGVVAPRGARVTIDGEPLQGEVEQLGPWDIHHATVRPGWHQLQTVEGVPFGVKVYGTARYTSYAYPGGLDLRLLTPG